MWYRGSGDFHYMHGLKRYIFLETPIMPIQQDSTNYYSRQIIAENMDFRPPRFQLIPLNIPVLFLQRDAAGEMELCVTGHQVIVAGGEHKGIDVQIVERGADGGF